MAMNPILTLVHNCLPLTKRLVDSVKRQDVETSLFVIDNDSTDGTRAWLGTQPDLTFVYMRPQLGVSAGWNLGLRSFFDDPKVAHVLVVNNDVELPPWFYSTLLDRSRRDRIPFLTGVAVDDRERVRYDPSYATVPHPDFSAFLITRRAWTRIGQFDERMVYYASDCDYHIRGWRAGVEMRKANVPFYHERSSTLRSAADADRVAIELQADLDRAALAAKWGCRPGDLAYAARFAADQWGCAAPKSPAAASARPDAP